LTVKNEAVETDGSPLARAYGNAGLMQRILLARNEGEPYWFWEWSGPSRGAPPEYEPIAPAGDIEQVAERITRVLALAGQ
jgi:hypothetical protein